MTSAPASLSHFHWRPKLTEDWLPRCNALDMRVRALGANSPPAEFDAIAIEARQLAGHALGPDEHLKIERLGQRMVSQHDRFSGLRPLRGGLMSNGTVSHLIPALSAAGLVRGLLVEAFEIPYQWMLRRAYGREETDQSGLSDALAPADFPARADASVVMLDENAFRGPDV